MFGAILQIIRILPIVFTLIGQIRDTFRGREYSRNDKPETPETTPKPPKPEAPKKKKQVEEIEEATKNSRMDELLEKFKEDHKEWVKANG